METVTIINNSGKIISTGKQLVNIFKEAKASYHEKKAALKAERTLRNAQRGKTHTFEIKRSRTVDLTASSGGRLLTYPEDDDDDDRDGPGRRRRSCDDTASRASSRRSSHRSHRSSRRKSAAPNGRGDAIVEEVEDDDDDNDVARTVSSSGTARRLTAANLEALRTEAADNGNGSGGNASFRNPDRTTPGRPPPTTTGNIHRSLTDPSIPVAPAPHDAAPVFHQPDFQPCSAAPASPPSPDNVRHRSPSPMSRGGHGSDDDLAYGSIPPNLAHRTDLDPRKPGMPARSKSMPVPQTVPRALPPAASAPDAAESGSESSEDEPDNSGEGQARALAERIEDLLDEAQCLHQSATTIITQLQGQPEAAAAVALALAELSALVTKLSPGFLTVLKGGMPAVFSLLASPHFLVAAGVAVGMTIVMFGGWKIIKRVKERNDDRIAFEGRALAHGPGRVLGEVESTIAGSVVGDGVPVALPAPVAEEPPPEPSLPRLPQSPQPPIEERLDPDLAKQLSSIECWRRGIAGGDDGDGDDDGDDDDDDDAAINDELLSPEAREAVRGTVKIGPAPSLHADAASESGRSSRSSRSHRSNKSRGSRKSSYTSYSLSRTRSVHDDAPDRKSGVVVVGRRSRSRSRSRSRPRDREPREKGSDFDSDRDRELERLVSLSATTRSISDWDASSVAPTERSSRTHRSSRSDRTSRTSRTSHTDKSDRTHRSSRDRDRERRPSHGEKLGGLRVIEEAMGEDGSDAGVDERDGRVKKRKESVFKSIFKSKLKREVARDGHSVLVV